MPRGTSLLRVSMLLALFIGSWGWIGCGQKEQQLHNVQKPLKIEPEEQIAAEVYYRRGRRYLQNGQYEEAVREFSQAVRLKPDFARALDQIGLAYTLQRRSGKAIPYYKKAIAQAPENGVFLMHLGKTYMDLCDYAQAKRAYGRALELGVKRAKIYYDLGLVSERENELEAARSYFQQAIQVNSEFADPYCRLGAVLEKQGEQTEAAHLYQQALKRDPRHISTHYRLAQLYLKQGRREEGQRLLRDFQHLKQAEPHLTPDGRKG